MSPAWTLPCIQTYKSSCLQTSLCSYISNNTSSQYKPRETLCFFPPNPTFHLPHGGPSPPAARPRPQVISTPSFPQTPPPGQQRITSISTTCHRHRYLSALSGQHPGWVMAKASNWPPCFCPFPLQAPLNPAAIMVLLKVKLHLLFKTFQ